MSKMSRERVLKKGQINHTLWTGVLPRPLLIHIEVNNIHTKEFVHPHLGPPLALVHFYQN